MSIIYEPTGKAREYSPLAANFYDGCDHGCKYCYAPGIRRKERIDYRDNVRPRSDIVKFVTSCVHCELSIVVGARG